MKVITELTEIKKYKKDSDLNDVLCKRTFWIYLVVNKWFEIRETPKDSRKIPVPFIVRQVKTCIDYALYHIRDKSFDVSK